MAERRSAGAEVSPFPKIALSATEDKGIQSRGAQPNRRKGASLEFSLKKPTTLMYCNLLDQLNLFYRG
jgi:hypothetical protein